MTTNNSIQTPIEDVVRIQTMFNAIAPTYDLLNHLLSFGLDIQWRKRAIRHLEEKRGGSFLDIACGSGDLSIEALKLSPSRLVATDFADTMLDVFRKKLVKHTITFPIQLVKCDALSLPFPENSFDATMVAFGIRNFTDRPRSLSEMHRVLKPGGLSLILELSRPGSPIPRTLYSLYAKIVLPMIGRIVSNHNRAYRYLPESIGNFPVQKEFVQLMHEALFQEILAIPLTFGTATIYIGRNVK